MANNWFLNVINHGILDRIKLAWFFLNSKNRWTIGAKVKEFEETFAKYLGVKYVVATSSGSTANSIISHYHKDKNIKEFNRGKKQVIFNGISWATNVNPWIRDGFEPVFLDINLEDFSLDYNKLEQYLEKNHKKVSCVFCTALIGYAPNITLLEEICLKYNVKLMFDFCESTLSGYLNKFENGYQFTNISKKHTSSHSFYVGHLLCGCEMGCIATNCEIEYQNFLMYRNHGLIRVIKNLDNVSNPIFSSLQNKLTDEAFTFAVVGNNYRPTEINAYTALLDIKRVDDYVKRRQFLFQLFYDNLNKYKFYLPSIYKYGYDNVHFCLPIIINPGYGDHKKKLTLSVLCKEYCNQNLIERRPIISQTFLRQKCYQQYGDYRELKNCEYLTKYGFYVGLNQKVKEQQILDLTAAINKL